MNSMADPLGLVGQMFGQFRVGHAVAGARSGLVYTGWDVAAQGTTGQPKPVWLRFFDSAYARDLESLRSQFDAWSSFEHRHYLSIIGTETTSSHRPLLATVPGEGTLLGQHFTDKRVNVIESVRIVTAMADVLAKAHANGLVHLGISDEAVVVPKYGDAAESILFGVGIATGFDRADVTTWHYLPPEQLTQSDCDARADVYALGVLLYRCLTGEYPIALPPNLSVEQIRGHLAGGKRRDPRSFMEVSVDGVVEVVERAIHPNRTKRYPTGAELARALRQLGLPLLAEVPREESDPKGVVITPPPAQAPQLRAGVDDRTFSPTPAPATSPSESKPDLHLVESTAGRPKTLVDDGGQAAAQADTLIGLVLKEVRIERPLGEGGMAKLYVAKHTRLGRSWAVKIADLQTADNAVQWFEQEALVTSVLREHGERRVPEVLDLGKLPDGRPYMVMELVPGRSLAAVLAETPRMPLIRALKIIYRVADTLERAHQLGFVHRDIKPTNIMVEEIHGKEEQNIRVLDWGVSKASGVAKQVKTSVGMLIGTAGYMDPDATAGEIADGRTDVFAIAAVLYEMFAGRRTFEGTNAWQVMEATRMTHPTPIAVLRPELPKVVSDLINLGLTKDREKRPTMADFKAGLKEIMDQMEGRRQPGAPSLLATMLSTSSPSGDLPLSHQATRAPIDAERRDFVVRSIAPDLTRPAKLANKPKRETGRRAALAVSALLLVVAAVIASYFVTSHHQTSTAPSAVKVAPLEQPAPRATEPAALPNPAEPSNVEQHAAITKDHSAPTKRTETKPKGPKHHGRGSDGKKTLNPFEDE